MRYVALLRGINVAGKHPIKMADLKACFEDQGLRDVATYIQSGNVLFTADAAPPAEIGRGIEAALAATFDCRTSAMLRTRKQMQAIVARAPRGFGAQPARYRYDVIYLKEPLTAPLAIKDVATKPGVDQVRAGNGVLYSSRLIAKATQSRLGRVVALPIYKNMTIRNWNTTTALLGMMGDD
jgi:uncharacterized protein (DUF1697 family)